MDDIMNTLTQAIEEAAFPHFFAQSEYRQNEHDVGEHLDWLEEHLNDEERGHLEQLRQAELRVTTLECEAEIRLALAVGIRLALVS